MKRSLFLLLAACSDATTAVDLELLPNPELSSVDDLVGRIRTVVVVVDAASGRLYPLDAERLDGNVQIKNADNDPGDLELVAIVPVPEGRLPRIRIERGGLPDVPLHIRVLGSADGENGVEIARGGVTGVTFVDGEIKDLATPFNMLPRFLPLRVTEIAPADGQVVPCESQITILSVFSHQLEPTSVTPPGRFTVDELGGGGEVLPKELDVALTSVTFVPSRAVVDYRVTLSTEIVDSDGAPLDQFPGMGGLQPYREEFRLQCSGTMTPVDRWCTPKDPTAPCPGPPGRFRCDAGKCVPNSCDGARCVDGFVCNPTTLACELDCALYGDCP